MAGASKGVAAFGVMAAGAVAIVGLLAITLTGIAVANEYKNTGLVDNATADAFITGLTIFGSFSSVIVISIVGIVIVNMFRGAGKGQL